MQSIFDSRKLAKSDNKCDVKNLAPEVEGFEIAARAIDL